MIVKTIAEFYAEVLEPVKDEALHWRMSPVKWDGEHLSFVNAPHVKAVPGEFHINDILIDGLRVNEWLEKQSATAPHAA
jgi:hypothetical protein